MKRVADTCSGVLVTTTIKTKGVGDVACRAGSSRVPLREIVQTDQLADQENLVPAQIQYVANLIR